MSERRHGRKTGFWDGVTTYNASTTLNGGLNIPAGPNTYSAPVQIGRSGDNFSFFINVTSAPAFITSFQLQVAYSGDQDSQGQYPDPDTTTYVWHDAYYLGTGANGSQIKVDVPSGGGAIMSFVPDFTSGWARLRRIDAGAAITVVAGYEVQGD